MKSITQTVTNLTLRSLNSNFPILLSIQWGSLENLIHLDLDYSDDIDYDQVKNDAFVQISSLSKNLHFLRISSRQTITTGRDSWIETVNRTGQGPTKSITIGIAFEESCGFPQLKTLHFNGEFFEDDNSFNAFKYFCEKSPMLEEIYLYGSLESFNGHENLFHTVYDNLCKSIGSLLNRPALRSLHINIFQP